MSITIVKRSPLQTFLHKIFPPGEVYYINGPQTLPPPLSHEEEAELIDRLAIDEGARNILVERNLRLVAHIMKKYYAQSADQEDLISIGTIGLIKGIETFDARKGAHVFRLFVGDHGDIFKAQIADNACVSADDAYISVGRRIGHYQVADLKAVAVQNAGKG